MDKTTAIVVGTMSVVLMLVLGAVGIAVITDDNGQAPAPMMTSAPAPTPEPSATPTSGADEFILEILEQTWNKQSYSDQQSLCTLFNYAPEQAWNAFDDGSEHLVPKDVFMEFFSGKCASIT